MSTLSAVREFVMSRQLIEETLEPLQRAGKAGYEAFVLWGGRLDSSALQLEFTSAHFPEQTTSKSRDGLLVVVQPGFDSSVCVLAG